jgi:hypothetical protein
MRKLLCVCFLFCASSFAGQTGGGHPSTSQPPLPPIDPCQIFECIFV